MVLEDSRPDLQSLSQLARQLNEATDHMTEELKKTEADLREMNLGVGVFLDGFLDEPLRETDGREGAHHWVLGYGKDDDSGEWCLLVGHYKIVGDILSDDMTKKLINTTPLLQASRDLRIAAKKQIRTLVKRLEIEGKKTLEAVQEVIDNR